jgi:hypothetical protein
VPIAAFSVVACGYVLWSCMKVLQGYNTGGNRINCVLAMITNSLIVGQAKIRTVSGNAHNVRDALIVLLIITNEFNLYI